MQHRARHGREAKGLVVDGPEKLTGVRRHMMPVKRLSLTDFKVRVLDTGKGTGAITRVLLDSTDGAREWTTIGVSENIIEASWQALVDSLVYGLLHAAD